MRSHGLGLLVFALLATVDAGAGTTRDITLPRRAPPTVLDEPAVGGRPGPAALALLRAHLRGRVARLQVGGTVLIVRHVVVDSLGLSFETSPGGRRSSPTPWAGVNRLETRHNALVPGIVTGAMALSIGGLELIAGAGPDPGPGVLLVLAFPPAGALVGGMVGAAIPRWQHEWPPAARPGP
jgi:hypothetical protein